MRNLFWPGWAGLVLCVNAWAGVVDDMKALVEQGKTSEAYELGKSHPEELGDPTYDFYFGVAAVSSGRSGEGVLALERYVLNFPDNAYGRLELARGYFVLGLIMLVAYLAAATFTMGPYISELAQHGFTPEALQAAGEHQVQRQLGGISLMTVIGWIVSGLVGGLGFAVWGGALAAVADGLLGTTDIDYAATFE